MNLLKLFFEFLKIGAFSFGGGMATLPYIYEMASRTSWITNDYINNILTLSQITPGPLACNIGTIVGNNVSGVLGAIIANIAFITPAIIFTSISYKFVKKIQKNKNASEIAKIVRASALAILISSSYSILKNAFLYSSNFTEVFSFKTGVNLINLKEFILAINFKSVFLAVVVYFLLKNKKINTLVVMGISAFVGVVLKV